MTVHRTTDQPSASSIEVVEWRRSRLLSAGFQPDLATQLADDCGIDLHAVLDLVDRGCPPALAARILAPLEQNRPC
jgi:hypothetical protein